MIDTDGYWLPDLYPKQQALMEACKSQAANIVLASGPRLASKTHGCQHAVCQHAWNVNVGTICLLTVSQAVGVDSGIWEHLTEKFLPDWIDNGHFGMEWVKRPRVVGTSKRHECVVSNQHGNKCKIVLESLKNEDEVEERFKGKEYSMIWVNELSKFKKRKTFDTLKLCLRGHPIADEDYLLLCDTNPDLDLGDQSWIYILWYLTRTADEELLAHLWPDANPKDFLALQKRLKLIEFTVDDNLWMTEDRKADLRATLAHDQALMDAYYWGKWVTASTDALFYRQFRPLIHVIGHSRTPGDSDPEVLVPSDACSRLFCGWDPGDSINSAFVIAEQIPMAIKVTTKDGAMLDRTVPTFNFLEELVVTGEPHLLEEFVVEAMRKMQFWQEITGRKIQWIHWSDRNVFERLSTESQTHLHKIIYNASLLALEQGLVVGVPPIVLQASDKPAIILRVDLWRKLLFENRMLFGKEWKLDGRAHGCPKLIAANSGLKPGKSQVSVIQAGSIHKHPWDAGSYLVSSECHGELARTVNRQRANQRRMSEISSVVAIPL